MSYNFYRRLTQLPPSQIRQPSTERLRAGNDTAMEIICYARIRLKIADTITHCEVAVAENLVYDLVLGISLLKKMEASIDLTQDRLSLYGGKAVITMSHTGYPANVLVAEQATIPAHTEAVIPVLLSGYIPDGDIMIESEESLENGLMVARTLPPVSRNSHPFRPVRTISRVLNVTDEAISLTPNMQIGTYSTVNTITTVKPEAPKPERLPSLMKMRRVLDEKGINLTDTTLTGTDLEELISTLYANRDLFALSEEELQGSNLPEFYIDTGDKLPVRSRPYRYGPDKTKFINETIANWERSGIVSKAENSNIFSSPLVIANAKGGKLRLCCDFRKINAITAPTFYTLPDVQSVIDMAGNYRPTLFTTLDLKSGYLQIKLSESARLKASFHTPTGQWSFNRLPFGLSNAPAHFAFLMSTVLNGLVGESAICYLDDVLLMGRTPHDMIQRIVEVFNRFRGARLKIHPQKCRFACDKVVYLGMEFSANGVSPQKDKVSVVKNFIPCSNPKEVKSFLGLTSYFRRFIQNYSQITAPLRALLQKDARFLWTESCQQAFDELKNRLTSKPILALPDFNRPFVVHCDASLSHIGFALTQIQDDEREHVVYFGSRALTAAERNYTIGELEAMSLVYCTQICYQYLSQRPFTVYTDSRTAQFIKSFRLNPQSARLTRWALHLQNFNFEIFHKKGNLNTVADALSRLPRDEPEIPPKDIDDDLLIFANEREITQTQFDFDYEDQHEVDVTITAIQTVERLLPTQTEIQRAQRESEDFKYLVKYLEKRELPDDDKLARRTVYESENFALIEGTLYHLYTPRVKNLHRIHPIVQQLCVTEEYRPIILRELHDGMCHTPGFDKLYALLRAHYWWAGAYTACKEYVKTCVPCQQSKHPIPKVKVPTTSFDAVRPRQRWVLDSHGSFATAKTGERHLLCCVDCASLWVEMAAVKDTSAATVVQFLFDNVFSRHGFPQSVSLLSDNAQAFRSELLRAFTKTFGIRHIFSSPYHPETNVRAESLAVSVHNALRTLCSSNPEDWPMHVNAISLALRMTPATNTALSPFEVMYGEPARLAIDSSLLPEGESFPSATQYIQVMKPKLTVIHEIAMRNAAASARRQKELHDRTAAEPPFTVGSKVLLYNPVTKRGQCAKLVLRWVGPMMIIAQKSQYSFKLKNLVTGQEMKRFVHANRLRPLHQLDNDYRLRAKPTDVVLLETNLVNTNCKVRISVGDILKANCDILVNPANSKLCHEEGLAKQIAESAGDEYLQECRDFIKVHRTLPIAGILSTTGGNLRPTIKAIVNTVGPNLFEEPFYSNSVLASQKLEATYFNVLKAAHDLSGLLSIAIPAISGGNFGIDPWSNSQAALVAVRKYSDLHKSKTTLRLINFVLLDLTSANAFAITFKQILGQQTDEDETMDADAPVVFQAKTRQRPGIVLFYTERHMLSQWYPCQFTVNGVEYNCVEQYMMHKKALTFGDNETAKAILKSANPKEQKRLGKTVKHFDESKWNNICYDVVKEGNIAKFSQNSVLKDYLVGTGDSLLAEASPTDLKWGIGLAANNPHAMNPDRWIGQNRLGKILMEVRSMLATTPTTADSRLDSAEDGDDLEDPDKTELYQVQTDHFTGDVTRLTTPMEKRDDQIYGPKESRDRGATSIISDKVEQKPFLETFTPQRASTPKPSVMSSHPLPAELIPGPSVVTDQTDFSADLPESFQHLESDSSDSPDSQKSLTMASRSLIEELQTLGDALQSWDDMRERERAGAPSGVVTRSAAAKVRPQQQHVKKDIRGVKNPKKPPDPKRERETSPVAARLPPLTLHTASEPVLLPFSSSGALGTQNKLISTSYSCSSKTQYPFGKLHSDVEPDKDVEENVRRSQSSSTEWFRANRILSYRRRRGDDFYLVEWEDGSKPSWVPRKDVSDPLLQNFYATRKERRRVRR